MAASQTRVKMSNNNNSQQITVATTQKMARCLTPFSHPARGCGGTWARVVPGGPFVFLFVKTVEIRFFLFVVSVEFHQ